MTPLSSSAGAVDVSELNALSAVLEHASKAIVASSFGVVSKGALNVKTNAVALAQGIGPHAKRYPSSIGYDIGGGLGRIVAEIGPDKDKPQGALGNLLEYGSSNNPPHAHLGPSLDREGPGFMAAADLAARGLL